MLLIRSKAFQWVCFETLFEREPFDRISLKFNRLTQNRPDRKLPCPADIPSPPEFIAQRPSTARSRRFASFVFARQLLLAPEPVVAVLDVASWMVWAV